MNLKSLGKLSLKSQLPILAGIVLVFGLFIAVSVSQKSQETRSKASGTGACNVNSAGDIIGDDCYMPSGFNGSIYGNGNTIGGGLGGSIFGNGNEIFGGVNGCIKGDNNIIHGGVNGAVVGTGNTIQGAQGSGTCPATPTSPPTVPPTLPPATCADGIDNNQNELIDAGDPACHTDGNQNNPGSYDPSRNEGPVTPTITQGPTITITPTVTTTLTPTVIPTVTILPTPTIPAGNTSFVIQLLLHGIGQAGDSANPQSGGNANPLHPQRNITVEVYNSQNTLVLTKTGLISYSSTAGDFKGTIDMGTTLTTGAYTVKVKTDQFLKALVPGIQNITNGTQNVIPVTVMINGDVNLDNTLNILDYNLLMGCYSDFMPAVSCTPANNLLSDLDDDGAVNQFDYNLFLRELTNRQGQ
ncbi:MAG TPA: hypothetical protein VLG67_02655 [Candidatus Saccharimonadales bacterium]|nr:hypothetical protein [Candidatus Saccharimonadales bacterium]